MMEENKGGSVYFIELDKIEPNPYQPRIDFDQDKLEALADSIKQYGVLQPIVVTRKEEYIEGEGIKTKYQIIAGERRFRAAKIAGLSKIPAIIREGQSTDSEKLELAIIENLQREDLNPVDKARAFKKLAEEFGMTHAEIAKKMGKSREYVSNLMRILLLPENILNGLKNGQITEGHTRSLLMLKDKPEEQQELYKRIISDKLTVRSADKLARSIASDKVRKRIDLDPELKKIERKIREKLGTKVSIDQKSIGDGGKLTIEFFSKDDLKKIVAMIGSGEILNDLKEENENDEERRVEDLEPKLFKEEIQALEKNQEENNLGEEVENEEKNNEEKKDNEIKNDFDVDEKGEEGEEKEEYLGFKPFVLSGEGDIVEQPVQNNEVEKNNDEGEKKEDEANILHDNFDLEKIETEEFEKFQEDLEKDFNLNNFEEKKIGEGLQKDEEKDFSEIEEDYHPSSLYPDQSSLNKGLKATFETSNSLEGEVKKELETSQEISNQDRLQEILMKTASKIQNGVEDVKDEKENEVSFEKKTEENEPKNEVENFLENQKPQSKNFYGQEVLDSVSKTDQILNSINHQENHNFDRVLEAMQKNLENKNQEENKVVGMENLEVKKEFEKEENRFNENNLSFDEQKESLIKEDGLKDLNDNLNKNDLNFVKEAEKEAEEVKGNELDEINQALNELNFDNLEKQESQNFAKNENVQKINIDDENEKESSSYDFDALYKEFLSKKEEYHHGSDEFITDSGKTDEELKKEPPVDPFNKEVNWSDTEMISSEIPQEFKKDNRVTEADLIKENHHSESGIQAETIGGDFSSFVPKKEGLSQNNFEGSIKEENITESNQPIEETTNNSNISFIPQDQKIETENQQPEEPKKKGFFARLFGK